MRVMPIRRASKILAEHIVNLVGAGVVQFVTFEVNPGTLEVVRHPLCKIQRTGTSDVVGEVAIHLIIEFRIASRLRIGELEFEKQRHQRFRNDAPAEIAKMPARVGTLTELALLLKSQVLFSKS